MHEHHHNCTHDHSLEKNSHSHKHHHHHHHGPKNYNVAFIFGITLNSLFVIIEGFYGYFSNSLALMADAGHNLSDVAGLIIAWGAIWLATKKPTSNYTFGLRKSSILSALFNAIFLMIAVGIIIWEALHRLWVPSLVIEYKMVIIVAGIGIVINSITALLFFKDKDHDLNIKGAYLHMAADALISAGVVLSGVIISYTSWNWVDPLVSIVISFIIIYGTWDLLKNSMRLSMDAVPLDIDPLAVKKYLESIDDVVEVHDLHIWAMGSTETALSAHLTVKKHSLENTQLAKISTDLQNKFKIHHPTIQVEFYEENFHCHLKPEDVL
ncbi:MAG: cation diffusion facilitator family transporter [Bacteriovorax sp.]|nr:cation diffusion facilitator family transporter [Bacteriovorax sp.]